MVSKHFLFLRVADYESEVGILKFKMANKLLKNKDIIIVSIIYYKKWSLGKIF